MNGDDKLKDYLVKYYRTILEGLFDSALNDDKKHYSPLFYAESNGDPTNKDWREAIELEISSRSEKIANYLVDRLKEENLLEPGSLSSKKYDKKIRKIIKETIAKFGGKSQDVPLDY